MLVFFSIGRTLEARRCSSNLPVFDVSVPNQTCFGPAGCHVYHRELHSSWWGWLFEVACKWCCQSFWDCCRECEREGNVVYPSSYRLSYSGAYWSTFPSIDFVWFELTCTFFNWETFSMPTDERWKRIRLWWRIVVLCFKFINYECRNDQWLFRKWSLIFMCGGTVLSYGRACAFGGDLAGMMSRCLGEFWTPTSFTVISPSALSGGFFPERATGSP